MRHLKEELFEALPKMTMHDYEHLNGRGSLTPPPVSLADRISYKGRMVDA